MDRPIVYPSEVLTDTDLLFGWQAGMIGIGGVLATMVGGQTAVWGLAVVPTSPASLSVVVGQGGLAYQTTVEASPYGSLPTTINAAALMKMGMNVLPTTLSAFTAPASSGQSVAILIEAACQDADGGATVLPYYNAGNPLAPYSGPGNDSADQNTRRFAPVTIQAKVGTPASTGSQATPAPDSGFVPLAVVTIANGATTVTSGNIALYPGVPLILRPTNPGHVILPGGLIRNFGNSVTVAGNSAVAVDYTLPFSVGATSCGFANGGTSTSVAIPAPNLLVRGAGSSLGSITISNPGTAEANYDWWAEGT